MLPPLPGTMLPFQRMSLTSQQSVRLVEIVTMGAVNVLVKKVLKVGLVKGCRARMVVVVMERVHRWNRWPITNCCCTMSIGTTIKFMVVDAMLDLPDTIVRCMSVPTAMIQ